MDEISPERKCKQLLYKRFVSKSCLMAMSVYLQEFGIDCALLAKVVDRIALFSKLWTMSRLLLRGHVQACCRHSPGTRGCSRGVGRFGPEAGGGNAGHYGRGGEVVSRLGGVWGQTVLDGEL